MKEITVDAVEQSLPAVTAFADEVLEEMGCPFRARMQLAVAIDELFGNIARYAYAPGTGKATLRVERAEDPSGVTLTFIDQGIAYDPLGREDPDVTLSAEERGIGGLGIYMVKKTMDGMAYERRDGQNILKITKKFAHI